ncbi:MAG TPA: hypothetical protein VMU08_08130 [Rhizomicrobium sp.]|nr:hypothetical protein [Rhizomicrobium sp.]
MAYSQGGYHSTGPLLPPAGVADFRFERCSSQAPNNKGPKNAAALIKTPVLSDRLVKAPISAGTAKKLTSPIQIKILAARCKKPLLVVKLISA